MTLRMTSACSVLIFRTQMTAHSTPPTGLGRSALSPSAHANEIQPRGAQRTPHHASCSPFELE